VRSSLFRYVTQNRSVRSNRHFETNYRFHIRGSSSPIVWTLNMEHPRTAKISFATQLNLEFTHLGIFYGFTCSPPPSRKWRYSLSHWQFPLSVTYFQGITHL
jgi:hypothetical protein